MRAKNRDEAERAVRLPLAELRDELGERIRWGGKLTEESTLEHVSEAVTLAVAIATRPLAEAIAVRLKSEPPPKPGSGGPRWKEIVETTRAAVIASIVDPNAESWVRTWVEAVVDGEIGRQKEAWFDVRPTTAVERLEQLESIRRAAHPTGPVERTCQVVEDESRLDGRCACGTLPESMKPCEVCRGR